MKRLTVWLLAGLIVVGMLSLGSLMPGLEKPALAEKPAGAEAKHAGRHGGGGRFGLLGTKMREELELTDEQVEKIKAIMKECFGDLRGKFKEAREDKEKFTALKENMEAAWKKAKAQIDEVLTAEQKAKIKEMREKGLKRFEEFKAKHKGEHKGKGGFLPLNLTEEQRGKVKALMAQIREAHKAGDTEKVKELRKKFADILTPEQKAKRAEMRKKWRENIKEWRKKRAEN